MKKKYYLLILLSLAGIVLYNLNSFSDRSKIKGGFEEVAFVRNENNRGAVLLYYAFTVANPEEADFGTLNNTLPYNKTSGLTTVFFFDKNKPYPLRLNLDYPHFDTLKYKPITIYQIDKTGQNSIKTVD